MMTFGKVALASAAAVVLASGCTRNPEPDEVEAALVDARTAARALGGELMGTLSSALNKTGPSGAIAVCNEHAPAVAARLSETPGLTIGRTALRVRNPGNAPDAWETETLQSFVADLAAGGDAGALEGHIVERTRDGWRVRWMKPIVLQPMCATCHGVDVDPVLAARIDAFYPDDAATGFAIGELRGAFTATIELPAS